jgi:hypothetical protein
VIQTSGSGDSQSTGSDDKAVSKAETYAQWLDPVPLGPGQDAQTNRRRLAPLITA